MTLQAAVGLSYFLCHSYSEALNVTMATERSRDDRYTPPLENSPCE